MASLIEVITFYFSATGLIKRSTCAGDENLDEMFKKELARRNINSVDDIKDKQSTKTRTGSTPPPQFQNDMQGQLERSRQLNSEGLEGLIPRATELVKLGLSFFLAFGPFIIAVVLASAAIYAVSSIRLYTDFIVKNIPIDTVTDSVP